MFPRSNTSGGVGNSPSMVGGTGVPFSIVFINDALNNYTTLDFLDRER